ncbi:sugar transferase [Alkalibacterium psychrotolerans]
MSMNRSNESSQLSIYNKKYTALFPIVKRIFDVLLSLVSIILLLPLLLLISFCIKISDFRAPVFFVQERIGLNETPFKMFKFRSMCTDAEKKLNGLLDKNEAEGALFKMKEDPRITTIGKFLRAYSLDELPQLFNVLKGDMSLIGPRPCLMREFQLYSDYHKNRLVVKPGITGLWQVSGRSGLTFDQMVELDIYYINNQSFKNDMKIFFKTFFVVFKKENAY